MPQEKPKRRWYQFSLRTMFVGIFVISIPLSWVGYQINWIRQRHQWFKNHGRIAFFGNPTVPAPSWLWLFGEEGEIEVISRRDEVEEASRLFPEAKIWVPDRPI